MAASTSHLWNRPIVGAECFTGTPFNSKLTEHPYAMKAEGDYMMTVGSIGLFIMFCSSAMSEKRR